MKNFYLELKRYREGKNMLIESYVYILDYLGKKLIIDNKEIRTTKDFIAILNKRRNDRGYSWAKISEITGISSTNLSLVRRGRKTTMYTLRKVCNKIGINIKEV